MKLKRIVEQQDAAAQYYDLGRDFSSFTQTLDTTTEDVKNKFEQAIASKLKGKKIRARASRGYKQFEKDYEINVVSVSLDDYYDNYVVVVKGNNGKEYFLKPGFKVQILGAAEEPKQDQPQQQPQQQEPSQPPQSQQTQQPKQPPPQAASQTPTPQEQPPVKENIKSYSILEVENDARKWLPNLFMRQDEDIKKYIPREGILKNEGKTSIITCGISIPVDDLPGLTSEQINNVLTEASNKESNTGGNNTIYKLKKFDSRGDKYVIIVNKITTT